MISLSTTVSGEPGPGHSLGRLDFSTVAMKSVRNPTSLQRMSAKPHPA